MTSRAAFALLFVLFAANIVGCSQPPAESGEHEEEEGEEAGDTTRTHIEAAVAEQSGIRTARIGPGTIRDEHEVQGLLTTVEGRHARVVARFPGPVRSVQVAVGDRVTSGQSLATIESNASLSNYAITAPFAGTVIARNVTVGDLAGDTPLFEIADLSKLWVDLHLFGGDADHIREGLAVEVQRLSDGARVSTVVDRVLPGTATASQSTVARATVINADGRWRPGSAVRARVSVAQDAAELVAPLSALQSMGGNDVLFVRNGEDYEVRTVKLGRRDGRQVEVVEGVNAGDEIVIEQSYLIKANIEKSSVEED